MMTTPDDVSGSGSEPLFFDREGHPVDLATYTRLYADPTYRFLARDTVAYGGVDPRVGDLTLVTAWIGVDLALGDLDRPMIFGSVALTADGGLFEDREVLAADAPEAMANHAALLSRLRQLAGG